MELPQHGMLGCMGFWRRTGLWEERGHEKKTSGGTTDAEELFLHAFLGALYYGAM